MTYNIKELVKRLRERPFRHASESDLEAIERRQSERVKAADALEAMASARAECERQYQEKVQEVITQMNRAEAERDRLKAVLDEAVKWMDGCAVSGGYPTWYAKARKALGGDAS